jgi:NTE family protein
VSDSTAFPLSVAPLSASPNTPSATASPASPATRIGVALGGGSARGYAHIGALAALERHGLAPDLVVGTSFGAIIGALYAAGLSPAQIAETATNVRLRDLWRVLDFGLHRAALFHGDRLEAYLDALLEGRHFSDLTRDFAVIATDLTSGERVALQTGPLARALRASASMPGVFAPVVWEDKRLVDGGLGSPMPLSTLEGYDVDLAIGIGVGLEGSESGAIRLAQRCLKAPWGQRVYLSLRDRPGDHPLRQLGRSFAHTLTAWQSVQMLSEEDLYVHAKPPIHWLNFHRAQDAIRAGEAALEEFIPRIQRALELASFPEREC